MYILLHFLRAINGRQATLIFLPISITWRLSRASIYLDSSNSERQPTSTSPSLTGHFPLLYTVRSKQLLCRYFIFVCCVASVENAIMATTSTTDLVSRDVHYLPPWANVSIIGIAGSSGSGKSTLSHAIVSKLNLPWVVILSMVIHTPDHI